MDSLTTRAFFVLASICKLVAAVFILILVKLIAYFFNFFVIQPPRDPLKNLCGPDGKFFQSHLNQILNPNLSPDTHDSWVQEYGSTFKFQGFGKYDYRLLSFDTKTITYVLNSPIYEKPWQTRSFLGRIIGRGIFSMEGAEHKRQRRILGPAFSGHAIKEMTPIMYEKAEELCLIWSDMITEDLKSQQHSLNEPKEMKTIEISHWLSRASFDTIGLTGFNYDFHALREESERVYKAYRYMISVTDKGIDLRGLVDLYFPWIRKIWPGEQNRMIARSYQIIDETGQKLIANKKAEVMNKRAYALERDDKDLLSLLIKSNLSNDPSKRLTDSELLDQCSTFLFAGSDSVSLSIAWALYHLAMHPECQVRLRQELTSLSNVLPDTDNSTQHETLHSDTSSRNDNKLDNAIRTITDNDWDILESLPYLDAVVRETFRISPTVHGTIRVAIKDDQIPISSPVRLRDGTILHDGDHISVRKGSYIHIPFEGINYSKELWGADARKFNPNRWFELQTEANPVMANTMVFGLGPHSCIGIKFCLAEIKIFLASLITNFSFSPIEGVEIRKHNAILTRPFIKDKFQDGIQLPLSVTPLHPELN